MPILQLLAIVCNVVGTMIFTFAFLHAVSHVVCQAFIFMAEKEFKVALGGNLIFTTIGAVMVSFGISILSL